MHVRTNHLLESGVSRGPARFVGKHQETEVMQS